MRRWRWLGLVLLVVLAGAGALFAVTQQRAAAVGTATLTTFEGTVNLQRPGTGAVHGRTGDSIATGDNLQTGPTAKAALSYVDGSLARLDSDTQLNVRSIASVKGGLATDLYQSSGKTWHRVTQLSGLATYKVSAPNNTTAEVRGTEFDVVVIQSGGQVTVRVDCWSGALDVSSGERKVTLLSGESVTVTAAGLDSPVAITSTIREDPWTVFNLGLDAVSGKVIAIYTGHLSSGESSQVQTGAEGDGAAGLQFTLNWPGSTFQLVVFDPDQGEYSRLGSGSPPLGISVPQARTGPWSFRVDDIESAPSELWVVIVSQLPPAPAGPASPPQPSASAEPSAGPPSPTPSAAPTPSPSATVTSTPQPVATPTPPVATPPATPTPVAPPFISSAALGTTKVNQPFSKQLVAHAGTLPYRWSLAGAPGWLVIDPGSGLLSGTPRAVGTYTLTAIVTDANGLQGSRQFAVSVIA